MDNKKILMIGTLGQNNIGDELMGKLFVEQYSKFYPDSRFVLNTYDPVQSEIDFGYNQKIKFFNTSNLFEIIRCLIESDIVVFAGGNIIKELYADYGSHEYSTLKKLDLLTKIAYRLNKQIYFDSIGVGPLNSDKGFGYAKAILDRGSQLTVRDAESMRLVGAIGIEGGYSFMPDIAFSQLVSTNQMLVTDISKLNTIGINLCRNIENNQIWSQKITQIALTLKQLKIINPDIRVIGIPMQTGFSTNDDILALAELKNQTDKFNLDFILNNVTDEKLILQTLDSLELVIGSRLHLLILATLKAVPFLALDYDIKVKGFLGNLELSQNLIPLDKSINHKSLISSIELVIKEYISIKNQLILKSKQFNKQILDQNTQKIKPLFKK
jgi:polysaccharide pyruvyl transferase WcaK-like protein